MGKTVGMKALGIMTVAVLLATGGTALAEDKIVEVEEVVRNCFGDIRNFCLDDIIGGSGLKACMKDNMTQLSEPCFEALMTMVTAGMPKPPDYVKTAKSMRFDNLRGVQYCELNFLYADLKNATLFTEMWNSSGLNTHGDPMNTCPADAWATVDPTALAKEHDVLGVWKNGPRGWTMDWIELPVGEVTTYGSWQGRWFAAPTLPKGVDPRDPGASAYKPLNVLRSSVMVFEKGKPVYLLDAPDGTVWVMQAWDKTIDKSLEYDGLKDLGSKLKLPKGWSFRVKVLDDDLVIKAVDGYARIMQDDLENTYDACLDGSCSITP